jgi:2-dehydro-3-deoxyglucarate aldolase/4-hydroxy-2-oxoheptanedioate aldolase
LFFCSAIHCKETDGMAIIDRLLEKIRIGQRAIGTHVTCNDPQQTEIIGDIGFDYLWIDTEHSVIGKYNLLQHLIAARAANIPCFVRIPWNDPVLAKPVLELGIQGIIFPMIETADDARKAVKSCLYPPDGIRGFGPRRAIRFGLDPVDAYIAAESRKILKLVQIETRAAVENIDAIASIPEVDILVLGPMDLSGGYGKLGKMDDPEIQGIYRHVVEKAHAAGKPVLVSHGVYTSERIAMWAEMGMDLITVGSDIGYIVQGARTALANAKEVFAKYDK